MGIRLNVFLLPGGYTVYWLGSPYPSDQRYEGYVSYVGSLGIYIVNEARYSARPALPGKLKIRAIVYLTITINKKYIFKTNSRA